MIPIVRVQLADAEIQAAKAAIESGWVSQGPRCAEFEARIASHVGVAYGRAVNSCTNAILLTLIALGVGPGDEIIVPGFTCVAALNPIRILGAVPVPVDVEPVAFGIDPNLLEQAITSRTRGVLFAHLFGLAADASSVGAICARRNLWLLEDIALGFGATDGGRPVGTVGKAAVMSFHPRKLITTGEGGMVLTDDATIATSVASLRNYGASVQSWDRHHAKLFELPGYAFAGLNCKLTDIQAAVGVEQSARVSDFIERRTHIARQYDEAFRDLPWAEAPRPRPGTAPSWQSYVLRVLPPQLGTAAAASARDRLFEHLYGRGVASVQGAQAMHRIALYADAYGWHPGDFPHSEEADRYTACLPIYPSMSEAEVADVIDAVRSFDVARW
jgi:dTDP-4-amino-4,6-dideoxygalactose transaminase